MVGRHRLTEADGPDECDRRQQHPDEEHGAPRSDGQDRLADERDDDRPDQEERREGRHYSGHPVALVEVARDREAQHRRRGRAEPPDEPGDEQQLQAGSERTRDGAEPVEHEAGGEHVAPTEAIREHPTEQLTDRHPGEVQGPGDRGADATGVEVEIGAELVERRERGVDPERHQDADEGEERDDGPIAAHDCAPVSRRDHGRTITTAQHDVDPGSMSCCYGRRHG